MKNKTTDAIGKLKLSLDDSYQKKLLRIANSEVAEQMNVEFGRLNMKISNLRKGTQDNSISEIEAWAEIKALEIEIRSF